MIETESSPIQPYTLPEPVRGSVFLLLSRIFLLMAGTDTIYIILRVFVFEWHSQLISSRAVDLIFFLFLVGSYILQIFLIFTVLLLWLNKKYYIEDSYLIVRKGIFTSKERTYELKNLKSVTVTQGIMGKLFRFGTLSITITAPNITEEVSLSEIPNPHKFEMQIKKFL